MNRVAFWSHARESELWRKKRASPSSTANPLELRYRYGRARVSRSYRPRRLSEALIGTVKKATRLSRLYRATVPPILVEVLWYLNRNPLSEGLLSRCFEHK